MSGLFEQLERIDKKLDLFNILGKSMPAVLIATTAILGSVAYVSSVANIPTTPVELPQTGEEVEDTAVTESFIILRPEYRSTMSLPATVSGIHVDGFYPDDYTIEFFVQKEQGLVRSIGTGEKADEIGVYETIWEEATRGKYYVWAEISQTDGTVHSSAKIVVNVI